ncbi:MAG TPA: FAD-dependent oxidoreductase, partial [Burkholderiaceae bacterium]|nr:FAD-dependent oxidoreductase [Burkholderiaceae bacterium]
MQAMALGFGFEFSQLYTRAGLTALDDVFCRALTEADATLGASFRSARDNTDTLDTKAESELLIALAPYLEDFLAQLFGIRSEVAALAERHHALAPLYACRRRFVQRKALRQVKLAETAVIDGAALETELAAKFGEPLTELAFAHHVTRWLEDEAAHTDALPIAMRYAAWATLTEAGRARHPASALFKTPATLDPLRLISHLHTDREAGYAVHSFDVKRLRRREGFALTDAGTDLAGALGEIHYCILCHEQGKDSCRHGLKESTKDSNVRAAFKKSSFGVTLAGCPLEEKISEFHKLKAEGCAVGALAMIVVDNPMAAATGHRICNDCMKSCIYQKQEPVNIPQAETRTLKDVLELPWGFEIYSLLTRWNPLNLRRPVPRAASGKRVLIAGMGPAGFTLAHHLMNDGHTVVGIDGLKIEPLAPELSGVDARGARVPFQPIRDVATLREDLGSRVMAGFGGVAEYGITVRWDKNFLKIIRLLLERRAEFSLIGGVRFGGTITAQEAFDIGFDHIALAMGAGRPTILELPNGLARGVRTASDFLMALQLTGAAKADSIANMQLRLPVVIVGGGLTAVDTATESLAYYPLQVEKFLARYEILIKERGEAAVRAGWSIEEADVAEEFIAHATAIREERATAAREGRAPRIVELLQTWGGATIAYRKRLIDSPSYTLNHEEVEKALEEGIRFAEGLTPLAVEIDTHGHARALKLGAQTRAADGDWQDAGVIELAARTILIAAGTQPNTVLARESDASGNTRLKLDGRYFAACDENGQAIKPEAAISKPESAHVLLKQEANGRFLSFFGDLHPSYFGNVVKAMGSAKQGYPTITRVLGRIAAASSVSDTEFLAHINKELRPTVHDVIRLTPNIVEIIVSAPAAARRFEPGQFYRLQNFESLARTVAGTRLAMEGLALTGAWVDKQQGLISTIVLEMGGSSDLCALLDLG